MSSTANTNYSSQRNGGRAEYSRYVFSTDFCRADMKSHQNAQPELQLPKAYMFQQIVDPAEFMLGENLNVANKRQIEFRPNRSRTSKGPVPSDGSRFSGYHSSGLAEVQVTTTGKLPGTILTKQEFASAVFHESALREYISSSSTAYDHAIRPLFDHSGFFPYETAITTTNRVMIRTSRLSFKTNYIGYPSQSIHKLSVFLTLVRGNKCISNIVEVEMKQCRKGKWRPSTFHEYDWIMDSDAEASMYAEVVASVRIPSMRSPFSIKAGLIAENSMGFIEYRKGGFHPLNDGNVRFFLNRNGEIPLDGQEAVLSFVVSHQTTKFPGLPDNFICPSDSTKVYEVMRVYMMKIFDPFFGNFSKWNPSLIEPIIFRDISLSDKALYALISAWADKTIEGLNKRVKIIYPSTTVMSKTGPYCLLVNADTVDKATVRVASGLVNGRMVPEENFKPFHTDELRRKLVLSIPAIVD